MIRTFQSKWMVALISAVIYLVSTWLFLPGRGYWRPLRKDGGGLLAAVPSWDYRNPDLERLLKEAKEQQAKNEERAKELQAFEERLNAEHAELATATQTVAHLQQSYDEDVLRFKDAEMANLKRLARTHAAMSPEGSANILKEMSDDEITRILALLKPDEAGPILEALGKVSPADAKRAAEISDRLRRLLPPGSP